MHLKGLAHSIGCFVIFIIMKILGANSKSANGKTGH
jgi:hypothetical protein